MAAGVIDCLEKRRLVERSHELGLYFLHRLGDLRKKYSGIIAEVRGRGLMLGLEVSPNVDGDSIYHKLIEEGFLVGHKSNVLRFLPAFIIEKEHIDQLIDRMEIIFKKLH